MLERSDPLRNAGAVAMRAFFGAVGFMSFMSNSFFFVDLRVKGSLGTKLIIRSNRLVGGWRRGSEA